MQDSVIHGFIPANRASHYRNDLKVGSIVRLDRFEVACVSHMYKVTEHQFVLRFIPSTRMGEAQTDAPVIKFDRFMVRRYDHLQVLANTNLELPGLCSLSTQIYLKPFHTNVAKVVSVWQMLLVKYAPCRVPI